MMFVWMHWDVSRRGDVQRERLGLMETGGFRFPGYDQPAPPPGDRSPDTTIAVSASATTTETNPHMEK